MSIRKKTEYRNKYFEIIIKKRLEAYEWLESQISILKTSIMDNDGSPCHYILSQDEKLYMENTQNLILANSKSLWLNGETNKKLNELVKIFSTINHNYDIRKPENLLLAGKKYYWQIAHLRDDLEDLVKDDLLSLYNFKKIKYKAKSINPEISIKED